MRILRWQQHKIFIILKALRSFLSVIAMAKLQLVLRMAYNTYSAVICS